MFKILPCQKIIINKIKNHKGEQWLASRWSYTLYLWAVVAISAGLVVTNSSITQGFNGNKFSFRNIDPSKLVDAAVI